MSVENELDMERSGLEGLFREDVRLSLGSLGHHAEFKVESVDGAAPGKDVLLWMERETLHACVMIGKFRSASCSVLPQGRVSLRDLVAMAFERTYLNTGVSVGRPVNDRAWSESEADKVVRPGAAGTGERFGGEHA